MLQARIGRHASGFLLVGVECECGSGVTQGPIGKPQAQHLVPPMSQNGVIVALTCRCGKYYAVQVRGTDITVFEVSRHNR